MEYFYHPHAIVKRVREERKDLNRELIEYFYQPVLIMKWIEAGNEIEDYLQ